MDYDIIPTILKWYQPYMFKYSVIAVLVIILLGYLYAEHCTDKKEQDGVSK